MGGSGPTGDVVGRKTVKYLAMEAPFWSEVAAGCSTRVEQCPGANLTRIADSFRTLQEHPHLATMSCLATTEPTFPTGNL